MRDHTKLKAFHEADTLAVLVYRLTRSFPAEERYGLTSQMRRAAVSIPSNIVEGCARSTETEYLRFLDIAFGSLRELQYQASLAHRVGCCDEATFRRLDDQATSCSKLLAGLIRALRPQQPNSR